MASKASIMRGAGMGQISEKAAARFKPPILSQTRVNRPKEEAFHGKQGRADQGGTKMRGVPETTHRNIDTRQTAGTPRNAGGVPSKGGRAMGTENPSVAQIDQATHQKPDWPRVGHGKNTNRAPARASNVSGPRSGSPQYGGPSNRKYG
jgi:hypothetical protein